jgi:ectoine hydroxylase-related dioxygenase (phytanoyl-CoA dioxygenase family)
MTSVESDTWAWQLEQAARPLYERDGVTPLRQPFESRWIDCLARSAEAILEDTQRNRTRYFLSSSLGRCDLYNISKVDPLVSRFINESPAAEICARVSGSKTVRFYFDVLFCKFPLGTAQSAEAATSLHHDVSAFGFKGTQLPTLWLALTDISENDAPLQVALGSHKDTSQLFRAYGNYLHAPPKGYKDHADIHHFVRERGFELRRFPLERGDALILHPYVIHGSVPMHHGGTARLGFCTRWMGDDVSWMPSSETTAEACSYPRSLPVGAQPPEQWFPTLWRRPAVSPRLEVER